MPRGILRPVGQSGIHAADGEVDRHRRYREDPVGPCPTEPHHEQSELMATADGAPRPERIESETRGPTLVAALGWMTDRLATVLPEPEDPSPTS